MSKKIISIVGARPNFVKAAMLDKALKKHLPDVEHLIYHTGQHYDQNMSDDFFQQFDINPVRIGLTSEVTESNKLGAGGRLATMLSHIVGNFYFHEQINTIDYVIVYGDTDSTLAGALAAKKSGIPLIHVEAGLRSYNPTMQEEANRIMIDHIADILFCPTETAHKNLQAERVAGSIVTGDLMYDAVLHYGQHKTVSDSVLHMNELRPKGYYLATVHRAETTDNPIILTQVLRGLAKLNQKTPVVIPMHPRTQEQIFKSNLKSELDGLRIIPPASYFEMQELIRHSSLVLTDSGGVQKEAFFHKIPCVTLRLETEWTELVRAGWNHTLGEFTVAAITEAAESHFDMGKVTDYGDGHAADKMVDIIRQLLHTDTNT